MLVFRFHRGSLSESLSTAKEFKSKEELNEFLKDDLDKWPGYAKEPIELTYEFYVDDDRLGSKDEIVSVKTTDGYDSILGMCSIDITLAEIEQNYHKWLKEYESR